jgi:hypothetical protein
MSADVTGIKAAECIFYCRLITMEDTHTSLAFICVYP